MKMEKASAADLRMAMDLCEAIEGLSGGPASVPAAIEKLEPGCDYEPFDCDSREQCVRVLGHLIDLAGSASLMRVVLGCYVMLDPRNLCVDPAKGTIEHHPFTIAGKAAHEPQPLAAWTVFTGPALWWNPADMSLPWVGMPTSANWPSEHTCWTPLIVPALKQPNTQSPQPELVPTP